MEKLQKMVLEFMVEKALPVRHAPTIPDFEECREMFAALQEHAVHGFGGAFMQQDPTQAAAALANTVHHAMRCACRMGIDIEKVFEAMRERRAEPRSLADADIALEP